MSDHGLDLNRSEHHISLSHMPATKACHLHHVDTPGALIYMTLLAQFDSYYIPGQGHVMCMPRSQQPAFPKDALRHFQLHVQCHP